jgi:hypothetical protein
MIEDSLMKLARIATVVVFIWSCAVWSHAAEPIAISTDRIKADIVFLASDRLEGRGPRGEELTIEFLAKEFAKAGLKPLGERGTYMQPVPLFRVATSRNSTLRATKGDTTIDFAIEEEFSGTSHTQKEMEQFDADVIFVGHGITAPEFGWDDYQNVDVKDKSWSYSRTSRRRTIRRSLAAKR